MLEGSIRKAGNRVRITAQLIRTDNGYHMWSENYDRELTGIFELQDEISLLIADKIRENFGHINIQDHLIVAPTQNVEAYNLYLKARFNHLKWDGDGIRNGIHFYEKSIEEDSEFALPYFGLGYCYAMYGSWGALPEMLQLSQQYIDQGFALDKNSAMGYFAQATLCFWGHWDFVGGVRNFHKAIEINPAHTEAEEGLAELYTATGHFKKAEEHVQSVLNISPLSTNHLFTMANIHFLQQNFAVALEWLNKSLELDPLFYTR